MKRMLSIGLLLFSLLVACNGNKQVPEPVEGPSSALSAVDSLMWRQPDSALALLQDYLACRDVACNVSNANDTIIEDVARYVSTTAYDRHYANLLLAELLYKNDYAQTNRAELLQAVGYFDSLVREAPPLKRGLGGLKTTQSPTQPDIIAFLSARAHYINGVGYYEHDSVVPACKEYLKALEVMEDHFEEEELVGKKAKFMALTYSHLTTLFSDLYLHEQAIYFGKESLKYYGKYDAVAWHIAWMLNIIGSQYDMMDDNDIANVYYIKALQVLPDTNNLTYRDIVTHLAYLSYKKGGSTESSIQLLHSIIAKAESDKEYYSRCMNLGEIFYHEAIFDSAWIYLSNVFQTTKNNNSKKQAAEWLVEICKAQDKESDATEYASFLVPFANLEENQSGIKSQLTEQYKNYGQQRQERVHQHDKKKSQRQAMMIIVCLLVLISSVFVLYIKNKKRKHKLETQIAAERHSHQIQKDTLSRRLKQKSQEVRELQDQLKQQNDKDAAVDPTISFNEEPVCRLIMERVKEGQFKSQMDCSIYKDFALSKEQLMALHSAANRHFEHFTDRLAQAYPDLTKNDLDYCCLYLLGLNDADIAALMQRAYNTVNERNSKLRRIFGCKSTISVALQAIAKEITTTDYQVVS